MFNRASQKIHFATQQEKIDQLINGGPKFMGWKGDRNPRDLNLKRLADLAGAPAPRPPRRYRRGLLRPAKVSTKKVAGRTDSPFSRIFDASKL